MLHTAITPNATGDVTDAFLARLVEPAPTVADSIVRSVGRMPIAEQIAVVQRIVESVRWSAMDYQDSQKLDRVLVNFATDMDEAAHEEDVRLHGRDDHTPSYWL